MTQCRSWPLFGLLALALVVRAGWADDQPAKEAKPTDCCKAKQEKQSAEKCCMEEAIKQLVYLGQMCNPCADENGDCQKCPLATPPKNRISVGLGLRCLAGIPAFVPSIEFECTTDCSKTACKPCDVTEAEPMQFRVQTKLLQENGKHPAVLCCPALTVAEGQEAFICVDQTCATMSRSGSAQAASPGSGRASKPACAMQVCVKETAPECASIELEVSYVPSAPHSRNRVVHLERSKIKSTIPYGKVVRLPLNGAWVEVEVNKVPEDCVVAPPMATAPPRAACAPPPYSVPVNPQMMTLRAFRKADGHLVVEPSPPCPMPCAPAPAACVMDCADGKYGYRVVAAQPMHMPMPVGQPLPPPVVPCAAMTCAQRDCGDSVIRAVVEEGKSCLQMQAAGADCCVSFSDLTLKFPGCASCKITPNGERVEISTPFASAVADSVSAGMGRNFIHLEGNVKITYHAKGREGTTCADRACIHLTEGNMTINLEVNEKASD